MSICIYIYNCPSKAFWTVLIISLALNGPKWYHCCQARTLLQLRLESPLEVSVPLMAKKKKKKNGKGEESCLLKTLTHSYIFIWGRNHSFLLTCVSLLEQTVPLATCPAPPLFTLEHPESWSPRAVERRERFNKPQLARSFVPEQRKFTKTFVLLAKVEKLSARLVPDPSFWCHGAPSPLRKADSK